VYRMGSEKACSPGKKQDKGGKGRGRADNARRSGWRKTSGRPMKDEAEGNS